MEQDEHSSDTKHVWRGVINKVMVARRVASIGRGGRRHTIHYLKRNRSFRLWDAPDEQEEAFIKRVMNSGPLMKKVARLLEPLCEADPSDVPDLAAEAIHQARSCTARMAWREATDANATMRTELSQCKRKYELLKAQFDSCRADFLKDVSRLRDEVRCRGDPEFGLDSKSRKLDVTYFFDPMNALLPHELDFSLKVIGEKLKMIFDTDPRVARTIDFGQAEKLKALAVNREVIRLKEALTKKTDELAEAYRSRALRKFNPDAEAKAQKSTENDNKPTASDALAKQMLERMEEKLGELRSSYRESQEQLEKQRQYGKDLACQFSKLEKELEVSDETQCSLRGALTRATDETLTLQKSLHEASGREQALEEKSRTLQERNTFLDKANAHFRSILEARAILDKAAISERLQMPRLTMTSIGGVPNMNSNSGRAMSRAKSVGLKKIQELKSRHGKSFLNVSAQAENWLTSFQEGQEIVNELKETAGDDDNKYKASLIVYKETFSSSKAVGQAKLVADKKVDELKGRLGNAFPDVASQAETWIASFEEGQRKLDDLKDASEGDDDKYHASLIVFREAISKSKAMAQAKLAGKKKVDELKTRHGDSFSNVASQAEAWITTPTDDSWTQEEGQKILKELQEAAEGDEEKCKASLIVFKEAFLKSKAMGQAMGQAKLVAPEKVEELKARLGNSFLNVGSHAETWITSFEKDGQKILDDLKDATKGDEEMYYASLIVFREEISKSKAMGQAKLVGSKKVEELKTRHGDGDAFLNASSLAKAWITAPTDETWTCEEGQKILKELKEAAGGNEEKCNASLIVFREAYLKTKADVQGKYLPSSLTCFIGKNLSELEDDEDLETEHAEMWSAQEEMAVRVEELQLENSRLRKELEEQGHSMVLLDGNAHLSQAKAFEDIAQAFCGTSMEGDNTKVDSAKDNYPTQARAGDITKVDSAKDNYPTQARVGARVRSYSIEKGEGSEEKIDALSERLKDSMHILKKELEGDDEENCGRVQKLVQEIGEVMADKLKEEAALVRKKGRHKSQKLLELAAMQPANEVGNEVAQVALELSGQVDKMYSFVARVAGECKSVASENAEIRKIFSQLGKDVQHATEALERSPTSSPKNDVHSAIHSRFAKVASCLAHVKTAQRVATQVQLHGVFNRLWQDSQKRVHREMTQHKEVKTDTSHYFTHERSSIENLHSQNGRTSPFANSPRTSETEFPELLNADASRSKSPPLHGMGSRRQSPPLHVVGARSKSPLGFNGEPPASSATFGHAVASAMLSDMHLRPRSCSPLPSEAIASPVASRTAAGSRTSAVPVRTFDPFRISDVVEPDSPMPHRRGSGGDRAPGSSSRNTSDKLAAPDSPLPTRRPSSKSGRPSSRSGLFPQSPTALSASWPLRSSSPVASRPSTPSSQRPQSPQTAASTTQKLQPQGPVGSVADIIMSTNTGFHSIRPPSGSRPVGKPRPSGQPAMAKSISEPFA